MNKIVWPILFALTLSACSTTSDKPAAVESRTAQPAGTGASAATSGTGTAGVSGSALPGATAATDPRKDPASPLSKRSVYFDYDKYEVKDEYRAMLEAHAGYLKANSGKRVILQGNADERGSREYNLALGQKRAEAVRKVMGVMGVSDVQMEAISFGEEKPRYPGTTEEAYTENRRTDLVYGDE